MTIAVILASGSLLTQIARWSHLPNVTGYITVGVITGPWCLSLIPSQYIERIGFVTDLALVFIAFGVGKYFKLSSLEASGEDMVTLTLLEFLTAGIFIIIVMLIMGLSLSSNPPSGAIGCAATPAFTVIAIRQYKIRRPFVDTIPQVVVLDDVVSLIAFNMYAAFVQISSSSKSATVSQIASPVLFNLLAPALGGLFDVMSSRLIRKRRSRDHSLVLACTIIMGVAGVCTSLNIFPLLACMASDTVYINASGNKYLFKRLNQFMPPLLVMFFVLSDMRPSIPSLTAVSVIGIVYSLVRIAGKHTDSALGSAVIRASPEIRRCFGLALAPQAGVSIGPAVLGQRMLPVESGRLLSTIIPSSRLLYEMVGPVYTRTSIKLSDSAPGEAGAGKSTVEKTASGKTVANDPPTARAEGAERPAVYKTDAAIQRERTLRKASDSSKEINTAVPIQQIPQGRAVT